MVVQTDVTIPCAPPRVPTFIGYFLVIRSRNEDACAGMAGQTGTGIEMAGPVNWPYVSSLPLSQGKVPGDPKP